VSLLADIDQFKMSQEVSEVPTGKFIPERQPVYISIYVILNDKNTS